MAPSSNQLRRRVKEGIKQIPQRNGPGIVAIDVTIARNPKNQPITSRLQSQLSGLVVDAKSQRFFEKYEKDICRWVIGTGVRAILVFEFTLRISPDGNRWIHEGTMFWFLTTHDEQEERELVSFERGFLRHMPNLEDLTTE